MLHQIKYIISLLLCFLAVKNKKTTLKVAFAFNDVKFYLATWLLITFNAPPALNHSICCSL